jgi:hypothetical protein
MLGAIMDRKIISRKAAKAAKAWRRNGFSQEVTEITETNQNTSPVGRGFFANLTLLARSVERNTKR